MIFNESGGMSLNFKVVGGTSAPSNPKENTIWVNTSTAIHAWDFSATEPNKISRNKNLIVYPYSETAKTKNGITFTANSNGTVTANGTAAANATFYLAWAGMPYGTILPAGTYTLSGASGNLNVGMRVDYYDGTYNYFTNDASVGIGGKTFTTTKHGVATVHVQVLSGKSVSNVVCKPQLEAGSTATSFVKGDATGQAWILTGASSQVAFNALKKNWLYVYPISAKQYVNGAWVDKTAKSYQGGKWVEWWDGEYYENGKFYTDYKTKTNGKVNINSTAVEIVTANNVACESFLVLGPQDITRFSKIDMTATHNYDNSGQSIVALFVAKTDDVSYKNAVAINSKTYASCAIGDSASLSLDVSGLTGVYYVYAGLHSGGASWGRERKILITKIKAT